MRSIIAVLGLTTPSTTTPHLPKITVCVSKSCSRASKASSYCDSFFLTPLSSPKLNHFTNHHHDQNTKNQQSRKPRVSNLSHSPAPTPAAPPHSLNPLHTRAHHSNESSFLILTTPASVSPSPPQHDSWKAAFDLVILKPSSNWATSQANRRQRTYTLCTIVDRVAIRGLQQRQRQHFPAPRNSRITSCSFLWAAERTRHKDVDSVT